MAFFSRSFGVVTLATFAATCSVPLVVERRPGTAPRCEDGVCYEIVSFSSNTRSVAAWVEAPHGTSLTNARLALKGADACQGQFPVEWVTVDEVIHRSGPADIGGAHGIVFGVPINAWWDPSSWPNAFLDLQLEVDGASRCIRARLTSADGAEANAP